MNYHAAGMPWGIREMTCGQLFWWNNKYNIIDSIPDVTVSYTGRYLHLFIHQCIYIFSIFFLRQIIHGNYTTHLKGINIYFETLITIYIMMHNIRYQYRHNFWDAYIIPKLHLIVKNIFSLVWIRLQLPIIGLYSYLLVV